ncbi:hypothetical protein H5410_034509 [Solanum commersonii]|uniref:Uncharacterized protein n=1 Tax=Solanum commersonii TaxID=4109 RepID=A0A9J5YQU8_SOLCO|nr:hypothetical protein H5410_034509 [Solanum commersonii]
MVRLKPGRDSSSSNISNYYSDTQSVGDDDDEEEELEAELHNMIVKLYIQLEGDRSDEDDGEELQHELEAELRDMIEKLYIEMEGDRVVSMLQGGILRYEDNAHDDDEEFRQVRESISSNVDKALLEENLELQAIEERIEAETLFASEVEQLKASIVKKNNDVEELNKILEAERDQLKARLAMLEA